MMKDIERNLTPQDLKHNRSHLVINCFKPHSKVIYYC